MITWAKLKDGSWGLRGPSKDVVAGASVAVTKRDGTVVTATVDKILAGPFQDTTVLASVRAPVRQRGFGCSCDGGCCRPRCRCESYCVCRGGNVYDC